MFALSVWWNEGWKLCFPQGLQGGEARSSRLHWLCGQHHGSGHARVSIQCVLLAASPVCCAGGVWGRKSVDTACIATCVTSLRDMGGGGGGEIWIWFIAYAQYSHMQSHWVSLLWYFVADTLTGCSHRLVAVWWMMMSRSISYRLYLRWELHVYGVSFFSIKDVSWFGWVAMGHCFVKQTDAVLQAWLCLNSAFFLQTLPPTVNSFKVQKNQSAKYS